MRKPHARIAAAFAVLAALAGPAACGSGDASGGRGRLDLKVGVLLPQTGFMQQFGPSGQQATNLAVDEIRKAAAKAGARHRVTLVTADDQSQPGPAALAAKKMQKQGTSCFVGPWGNQGAEKVMLQTSAPKKVLEISPAASGDAITKAEDRGYLARVVPPDRLQAEALAELMDKKLHGARGKTVNIGALRSTYGNDLTSAFEDAWTGKGGRVGKKVTYKADQPTFEDEVDALASGNPKAWVFFDFLETFPRLAGDLMTRKDVKFGPRKAFAGDSLANPRLGSVAANASQGLRGVAIGAPNRGAAAKEFGKRLQSRGPAKRQTFDAQAFDATVLCYLSAVAAGSTSGKAMAAKVREVSAPPGRKYNWLQLDQAVKALQAGEDIDYDGASGPIDLNDAGDPTAGVYDVYKFKKGKLLIREQIAIPEGKGGI